MILPASASSVEDELAGLTSAEAARGLKEYGRNEIPEKVVSLFEMALK